MSSKYCICADVGNGSVHHLHDLPIPLGSKMPFVTLLDMNLPLLDMTFCVPWHAGRYPS